MKTRQLGSLFLVPSPLSEDQIDTIPPIVITTLLTIRDYIVENERTAKRFLSKVIDNGIIDSSAFTILNEHTLPESLTVLLKPAFEGRNIALLSEAGNPCIADPGMQLVAVAHRNKIRTVPLPGPTSILLALAASGLNGQSFSFNGYLPREKTELKKKLEFFEKESFQTGKTQIFIETPYRNVSLLNTMLNILKSDTMLCIACAIGSREEWIHTDKISNWRKVNPEIAKHPSVFCIYAGKDVRYL